MWIAAVAGTASAAVKGCKAEEAEGEDEEEEGEEEEEEVELSDHLAELGLQKLADYEGKELAPSQDDGNEKRRELAAIELLIECELAGATGKALMRKQVMLWQCAVMRAQLDAL